MKIYSLILWLSVASYPFSAIQAQKNASINIEISSDSIGLDDNLEVSISIENAKVKHFTAPKFDGFDVQGPSTSTSMSIVNGDMTQSATYTYYLTPRTKGSFTISPASVDTEGSGTLTTEEKQVVVLDNVDITAKPKKRPQSLWDNDFFFQRPTMPQPRIEEKTKKKYTTEKI